MHAANETGWLLFACAPVHALRVLESACFWRGKIDVLDDPPAPLQPADRSSDLKLWREPERAGRYSAFWSEEGDQANVDSRLILTACRVIVLVEEGHVRVVVSKLNSREKAFHHLVFVGDGELV